MEHYLSGVPSPLGPLTLRCTDTALTGLWLDSQKHFPTFSKSQCVGSHPIFDLTICWLQDYFGGKAPDPQRILIEFLGTPFQNAVWEQLARIPYGQTVSYKEIAIAIRKPGACQAVGGAVGRNPISIIVPCHRVIGRNGDLVGFDGGLPAKQFLLSLERESACVLLS